MIKISKFLLIVMLLASCKSKQTTSSANTATIQKVKTPEILETPQISDENVVHSKVEKTEETIKITVQEANQNKVIEAQPATEKKSDKEIFNHSDWHKLLQLNVTAQGKVNYKAFKANRKQLNNYIISLSGQMPDDTWTKNDVLAYWINAYNALTVDLIVRNYPVKSIKDIKDPWDQRLWKLGDKWYNLNEIEHQILRKMNEPRVHFAIVCASFSCPKLQNYAFTATDLETQLTESTKAFLADTNRNVITEDQLKLSKIFQWFTKDFKQNGSLLDFINAYTSININPNAKISYLDYNWDLNE